MGAGLPVRYFAIGMLSKFRPRSVVAWPQILSAALLLGFLLPAVSAAGSPVLGATSLSFSAIQGANPKDQSFYASFNATVTASTNNGGNWLAFYAFATGASTDTTLLVGLQVNSQNLAPGSYTGQLTLTPSLGGSAAIVAVNLQVLATGTVAYGVTPAILQASAPVGGNANSQTLSIGAIGGTAVLPQVTATTASGGAWLALSAPATYTFNTTSTVQVNFNTASLAAGYYTATITAAGAGVQNSPVAIPVNLRVFTDQYPVGDSFPYTGDSVGEFGQGVLNTLSLITALRAVTNLPGFRPATCADRFDAMDSYPVDGSSDPTILPGRPGGDGVLDTRDLIATLRRVTNIDTSRPTRTTRGISVCPSTATTAQSRTAPSQAEGRLEFGTPVANGRGGWRVPILLRANVDMDLAGISFSTGYDSVPAGAQLDLVAAGQQPGVPGLIDSGIPGAIAVAWLDGWRAKAGEVVEMGYLETSLAVDSLRFFGVSANAVSGGRPVPISLSEPYREPR